MSDKLIEATNVQKMYGGYRALQGISLSIQDGEHVSVVGPNGAGKTTLVNVLSGTVAPSSGSVKYKGEDISYKGPVRLSQLGMARSFQLVHIFPDLTIRETLRVPVLSRLRQGWRFYAPLAQREMTDIAVEEVAAAFGLASRIDRRTKTLSQGEKKLLDIASAFALKPEVIMLDEPTSGVSTADKAQIMQVLVSAAKMAGIRAIIQVEHDMDIVFGYSTRVVAVHEGKILADAPPDDLRKNDDVMATIVGRGHHA